MKLSRVPTSWILLLLLALFAAPAVVVVAQEGDSAASESVEPTLPASWLEPMKWRSIGPANMGGRITSIAHHPTEPSVYWVGTAAGGLLKTTNNGTTYTHQFEHEAASSIGDVQVAESNPDVVWVGTGEANPRNSVSWGNGVYKSTDGGETWEHKGLEETFQVGRIAIHPENPDVVYVGALGRLWGESEERGLYKTTDGGETWEKVLYVDEKTGVIDAQMKPGEPDTLLVATYERQRDGFDTNDPMKKWGPGSGIWRTTDGGQTWTEVTEGLPTLMMGRIGLDFYRKDPNVVFAVIESEKITQLPEDSAYMGVRGEDAQVGARITEVVEKGPAKEAGVKSGDIVIRMEDEAILSYDGLVAEIRKHLAGETVQIEVVRDGEVEKLEVSFTRIPEEEEDDPRGRRRGPGGRARRARAGSPPGETATAREAAEAETTEAGEEAEEAEAGKEEEETEEGEEAEEESEEGEEGEGTEEESEVTDQREVRSGPFSSGLGGQRENVHEQQGPEGHEYGGVYRSDDGGVTWTRINSVNPRPMYYSQIRVDPSDSSYVYVLGTSLYRSKDGGATFTPDGARGGVHVDHHALWIDPSDGRHMVLGNDGGIYVTFDRMENWDHHNHVAIGQFYRVSVDTTRNYKVYGGLQDNGSWGGPNRVRDHRGPVNDDWIRVGGGDGFACAVDRDDPNLVYAESQNGGLSRMHLVTGERGFLRPRAPRGQQYRFNWNTPFLLSHHNTKMYYTAGNHVFRSFDRGNDLKAISPEITQTDRGSATALAESPRDPLVLYAGTDDGALWMTKNGGQNWIDLFDPPETEEPEPEEPSEDDAEITSAGAEGPSETASDSPEAAPDDVLLGSWRGEVLSDMIPEGEGSFTMAIRRAESGELTGSLESDMGNSELRDIRFDPESGEVSMDSVRDEITARLEGTLAGTKIQGTITVSAAGFSMEFEVERTGGPGRPARREDPNRTGHDWAPIAELLPGRLWVSAIEASRFKDGRVYVTFDAHRSDDDEPYVFVSEDHGLTWRSIRSNLPTSAGTTREIEEDIENEDVLYLGCEFSVWVSIDRGVSWTKLNNNLPTVPVHEIAQHPTSGEIVAATHARSLWILDVSTLRQLGEEKMEERAHLYAPSTAILWQSRPSRGSSGLRRFVGENPPSSASIDYSLARDAPRVRIEIRGHDGEVIRTLDGGEKAGFHRVTWDLRRERQGGDRRSRFRRAPRVEPGRYLVALKVDGMTLTRDLVVAGDPDSTGTTFLSFEDLENPYLGEEESDPQDE